MTDRHSLLIALALAGVALLALRVWPGSAPVSRPAFFAAAGFVAGRILRMLVLPPRNRGPPRRASSHR